MSTSTSGHGRTKAKVHDNYCISGVRDCSAVYTSVCMCTQNRGVFQLCGVLCTYFLPTHARNGAAPYVQHCLVHSTSVTGASLLQGYPDMCRMWGKPLAHSLTPVCVCVCVFVKLEFGDLRPGIKSSVNNNCHC